MAFDKIAPPVEGQSSMLPTLQSPISKERLLLITKCARALFSAYPASDFEDPKAALASYVEVLSGYSDAIVQHVTGNRTGIQRRSKFPPRIAELVEACDTAAAILERHNRFSNWGQSNTKAIEGPKEPRPTKEEMEAKYGPNYGLAPVNGDRAGTTAKTAPSWDEIGKMYSADPDRIKALTHGK